MNDLTISNLQTILPDRDATKKQATDGSSSPFNEFVKRSLADVNRQVVDADRAANDLATGKNQDIHYTMISMQKAEISFELVMQIRNKLMSAYDEIRLLNGHSTNFVEWPLLLLRSSAKWTFDEIRRMSI